MQVLIFSNKENKTQRKKYSNLVFSFIFRENVAIDTPYFCVVVDDQTFRELHIGRKRKK